MITETDRLSRALDLAEKIWPEQKGERAVLVRHILETGIQALEAQHEKNQQQTQSQIEATAGSLDQVWPPDWQHELRNEWPM